MPSSCPGSCRASPTKDLQGTRDRAGIVATATGLESNGVGSATIGACLNGPKFLLPTYGKHFSAGIWSMPAVICHIGPSCLNFMRDTVLSPDIGMILSLGRVRTVRIAFTKMKSRNHKNISMAQVTKHNSSSEDRNYIAISETGSSAVNVEKLRSLPSFHDSIRQTVFHSQQPAGLGT